MFKCIFNIYIKMYFFNVHKKPWTDTEDTSKNATCQSVGGGQTSSRMDLRPHFTPPQFFYLYFRKL